MIIRIAIYSSFHRQVLGTVFFISSDFFVWRLSCSIIPLNPEQKKDGPMKKDGPLKKDGPTKKDGPMKKDGPLKKMDQWKKNSSSKNELKLFEKVADFLSSFFYSSVTLLWVAYYCKCLLMIINAY